MPGGASGPGTAVAKALAAAGARVTIFDRDVANGAKCASETCEDFAEVDVSDTYSVAEGLKGVGDPLRTLVNCAGVAPGRRLFREASLTTRISSRKRSR